MAFFFATPEDLLPVLLSIEGRREVAYTLFGHVNEPRVQTFYTARDLPTLFQPAPNESAVAGPQYLVTEPPALVRLRELKPFRGLNRWTVDQIDNPDSIVLQHGGIFGEGILLKGEVRTVSRTLVATRLQRAFDAAIRRDFVKISAFYVGAKAEHLLDAGWRLTIAKQSPLQFDLRRPTSADTTPRSNR